MDDGDGSSMDRMPERGKERTGANGVVPAFHLSAC